MGNLAEKLEEIAHENDWGFMSDYSGRFMFGKLCCGIIADNSISVIEECAVNGIRGAIVDNLGLDYIVYFPDIQMEL